MPAGQTSLDLWVPDEVTMYGAPLRQDAVMALIVERLLSRGLFPHGFTAGAGGRTYHYRQEPPRPASGVPSPTAPRVVPRDVQVRAVYQVHVEHRVSGDTAALVADLRVTVESIAADIIVLDVLAERGTQREPTHEMFRDVRFKLSIPMRVGALIAADKDDPNRFEFPEPQPDDLTRGLITGLFNTFNFEQCIAPRQPHVTGDKWTELIQTWFFREVKIAWEAGPVMVHAGGAFALYDAVWHIKAALDAPPTLPMFRVSLSVRTDDGFVGDCKVEDSTLAPDHPITISEITSTRIER